MEGDLRRLRQRGIPVANADAMEIAPLPNALREGSMGGQGMGY